MSRRLIATAALALALPVAAPAPAQDPVPFVDIGVNAQGARVFTRSRDGARVVWIPAGPFQQRAYTRHADDDVPMRTVVLDGYAIDECEVTNARFAAFLNASGRDEAAAAAWVRPVAQGVRCEGGRWRPETGCARLPALGVTGHGALAYAKWVGGDLPTIAEWQKAAGGVDGRLYPWGDAPATATHANFAAGGPGGPTPVGAYPSGASPFGCLDMAGNVAERVWTVARRGRPAAPVMIRGAGWASPHPLNLRTACLCMQPMTVADRTVGFRCVVRSGPGLPPRVGERLRVASDWEGAHREAKERNCPIFLSLHLDTCGQCDRTKVGLFRDPAFVRYANEHAVVVVGQNPGDAGLEPHASLEDGSCPLLPGITCLDHEAIYAEVLPLVGRFRMSPGHFILDPRVGDDRPPSERILVPESRFPKWGGGADVFIAALKEAQSKLGTPVGYRAWQAKRRSDPADSR